MKDLILVVADKNMHFALRGALNRPEALGIRPITVEFFVHPGRDGGVRKSGAELLALKRSAANHGMIVLDYDGCGAASPAGNVEAELTHRLVPKWGGQRPSVGHRTGAGRLAVGRGERLENRTLVEPPRLHPRLAARARLRSRRTRKA